MDVSILGAAFKCPACGSDCEPTVSYDPVMNEHVDAWACPSCERKYYRAEGAGEGVSFHGVARRVRDRFF